MTLRAVEFFIVAVINLVPAPKALDKAPELPAWWAQPVTMAAPLTNVQVPQTLPNVQPENITPTPPTAHTSATTPASAPVSASSSSACGDNQYSQYIYKHESGCSLTVTNSLGCLGIGQACPGSKLRSACPNLDYTCENNYFTTYANSAYGGWSGAYSFWLKNHWW